jgi:steroid delta-isomerase-like uncharacterized protein
MSDAPHSSPSRNVAAIRALIEAWNSHQVQRVEPFFTPDFENHQAPFPPVVGRQAYLEHCAHWFSAMPDFHMEELNLFGDGALVCLESYSTGTLTAPFFGTPSSGDDVEVHALDVFEFTLEGLVARERGFWDFSVVTGALAPRARRPAEER